MLRASLKRPSNAARELQLQLGNFGRKQLAADLPGPIGDSGEWLYRVIAVCRDSGTQVDHVSDDRRLLAPYPTWRPSDATSLNLQRACRRTAAAR